MPDPPKNIKLSAKEIVNSLPAISYKDYLNYKPEPKRNFPVNLNLHSTGNLRDTSVSGRLDIPLSERLNLNLNAGKNSYGAGFSYKFDKGGTIPKHDHPHTAETDKSRVYEDGIRYVDPNNTGPLNLKFTSNGGAYEEIDGKYYKYKFTADKDKINYNPKEGIDWNPDQTLDASGSMSKEEKEKYDNRYADQMYAGEEERIKSLAKDGFDADGNYAVWRDKGYSSADDYYDMMGDQGKYSYASMAKDMAELTAKKIKNDPMGALHMGLDAAGMTPGIGIIPDMINAGLYGLEGVGKSILGEDAGGAWENMGYSSSAAIPLAGLFATPAKYVRKGYQKLKPKNPFKSSKPKLVDQTQIKNIANEPMVRVYTSDGSVKMMPKSQAIRLSRVEDANMDFNKLNDYESGNWFASEPLDFYNRKTKRGLNLHESAGKGEYGRSYLLDPSEPRRLLTAYVDPEDAKAFNVLNSSQTAKNMSGGIGDPLDYEYVLPPYLTNTMRTHPNPNPNLGFNVQYGNYDEIGKYMDDFYKRFGGPMYATGKGFLNNYKNGGEIEGPKARWNRERQEKFQAETEALTKLEKEQAQELQDAKTQYEANKISYTDYQATASRNRKILETERTRVQNVRDNVLNTAADLDIKKQQIFRVPYSNQTDIQREAEAYYDNILSPSYNEDNSLKTKADQKEAIKNMPQALKDVLPNEGLYDLFMYNKFDDSGNLINRQNPGQPVTDATDQDQVKYRSNRGLYCTPGSTDCYRRAGADDMPVLSGNLGFYNKAEAGKIPFQQIADTEAELGDMALIKGVAPQDYAVSNSPDVERVHHTTVVSDLGPLEDGQINEMYAYSPRGGNRERFSSDPYYVDPNSTRGDQDLLFYRYVGNTPQLEKNVRPENLAKDYPVTEMPTFDKTDYQHSNRMPSRGAAYIGKPDAQLAAEQNRIVEQMNTFDPTANMNKRELRKYNKLGDQANFPSLAYNYNTDLSKANKTSPIVFDEPVYDPWEIEAPSDLEEDHDDGFAYGGAFPTEPDEVPTEVPGTKQDFINSIRNFKLRNVSGPSMNKNVAIGLQALSNYGFNPENPTTITSLLRGSGTNAGVGGVENSRHLSGNAMDISSKKDSKEFIDWTHTPEGAKWLKDFNINRIDERDKPDASHWHFGFNDPENTENIENYKFYNQVYDKYKSPEGYMDFDKYMNMPQLEPGDFDPVQVEPRPIAKIDNLGPSPTLQELPEVANTNTTARAYNDLLASRDKLRNFPTIDSDMLTGNRRGGTISPGKASKILHDGTVHGKPITDKQRRFFGAMSNKKYGGRPYPSAPYYPYKGETLRIDKNYDKTHVQPSVFAYGGTAEPEPYYYGATSKYSPTGTQNRQYDHGGPHSPYPDVDVMDFDPEQRGIINERLSEANKAQMSAYEGYDVGDWEKNMAGLAVNTVPRNSWTGSAIDTPGTKGTYPSAIDNPNYTTSTNYTNTGKYVTPRDSRITLDNQNLLKDHYNSRLGEVDIMNNPLYSYNYSEMQGRDDAGSLTGDNYYAPNISLNKAPTQPTYSELTTGIKQVPMLNPNHTLQANKQRNNVRRNPNKPNYMKNISGRKTQEALKNKYLYANSKYDVNNPVEGVNQYVPYGDLRGKARRQAIPATEDETTYFRNNESVSQRQYEGAERYNQGKYDKYVQNVDNWNKQVKGTKDFFKFVDKRGGKLKHGGTHPTWQEKKNAENRTAWEKQTKDYWAGQDKYQQDVEGYKGYTAAQGALTAEQERTGQARAKAVELGKKAYHDPEYREQILNHYIKPGEWNNYNPMYCSSRSCELERAAGYTMPGTDDPVKRISGTHSWKGKSKDMGYQQVDPRNIEAGDRILYGGDNPYHSLIYAGTSGDDHMVLNDHGSGSNWDYNPSPDINSVLGGDPMDDTNNYNAYRYVGNTPQLQQNVDAYGNMVEPVAPTGGMPSLPMKFMNTNIQDRQIQNVPAPNYDHLNKRGKMKRKFRKRGGPGDPPTQKEFDALTQAEKEAVVKQYPERYKISSDIPSAEDLQNFQVGPGGYGTIEEYNMSDAETRAKWDAWAKGTQTYPHPTQIGDYAKGGYMGINPDHKGYCTPMSKSTCTPPRKALARRLKPGGDLYRGNKEKGGYMNYLANGGPVNPYDTSGYYSGYDSLDSIGNTPTQPGGMPNLTGTDFFDTGDPALGGTGTTGTNTGGNNMGQYANYAMTAANIGTDIANTENYWENEAAMNKSSDQIISMIPGYGPFHGMATSAADMATPDAAATNYDEQGNVEGQKFDSKFDKQANVWLKPEHEYMTQNIADKDWKGLTRTLMAPHSNQMIETFTGGNTVGDMGYVEQSGSARNTVPGFEQQTSGGGQNINYLDTNIPQQTKRGGYQRYFQNGGEMPQLAEFNGGYTHDDASAGNMNQGIPVGPNGTVEKNETMADSKDGSKFIFTDTTTMTKDIANEYGYPKRFVGKTYADISKSLKPGGWAKRIDDTEDNTTMKLETDRLIGAWEKQEEDEFNKKMATMAEEHPQKFEQMMQAQQQAEQMMQQQQMQQQQGQGQEQQMQQGPSPEEQAMMAQQQGAPQGMPPQGMAPQGMPMGKMGGHRGSSCGCHEMGGYMDYLQGDKKLGGTGMKAVGNVLEQGSSYLNLIPGVGNILAPVVGGIGGAMTSDAGSSVGEIAKNVGFGAAGSIPGVGQFTGVGEQLLDKGLDIADVETASEKHREEQWEINPEEQARLEANDAKVNQVLGAVNQAVSLGSDINKGIKGTQDANFVKGDKDLAGWAPKGTTSGIDPITGDAMSFAPGAAPVSGGFDMSATSSLPSIDAGMRRGGRLYETGGPLEESDPTKWTDDERKAFQEWANAEAGSDVTKIEGGDYGWGPASKKVWQDYKDKYVAKVKSDAETAAYLQQSRIDEGLYDINPQTNVYDIPAYGGTDAIQAQIQTDLGEDPGIVTEGTLGNEENIVPGPYKKDYYWESPLEEKDDDGIDTGVTEEGYKQHEGYEHKRTPAEKLAAAGTPLWNVGQGIYGMTQTPDKLGRIDPIQAERVDYSEAVKRAQEAAAGQRMSLRNAGTAGYVPRMQKSYIDTMNYIGGVEQQEANANAQARMRVNAANAGIAGKNLEMKKYEQAYEDKAKAANAAMIGEGLSQLDRLRQEGEMNRMVAQGLYPMIAPEYADYYSYGKRKNKDT